MSESSIEVDDPLIGLVVGNYRVVKRIGAGGIGTVYECRHKDLPEQRAAMKVLRPEAAENTQWVERFRIEAVALSSVRSSHIVKILDFGRLADGTQYIMMEYVDGKPLDEYAPPKSLDVVTILNVVEQTLRGLGAAHSQKVYHRDLKPANVMVGTENNELKVSLVDFGLARATPLAMQLSNKRNDKTSLLAGTPEYVSPEQARGEVVDGRADLYSLGVMLYELLTGELPFKGETAVDLITGHLQNPVPELPEDVLNSTPEELHVILASLLAKSRDDRPPSADAVRKEVLRIIRKLNPGTFVGRNPLAEGPPRPAVPPTQIIDRSAHNTERALAEAFPEKKKRGVWLAVLAVLILALIGALVALPEEAAAPVPETVAPEEPVAKVEAEFPEPELDPIAPPANTEEPPQVEQPTEPPPVAEVKPVRNTPPKKNGKSSKTEQAATEQASNPPAQPDLKFNRSCADLDTWRRDERRRAADIETAARQQLLAANTPSEEIRLKMETLALVRKQIRDASTAAECDRAIKSLTAWAVAHGL